MRDIEDRLHAAPAGTIEAELVAIALEQTGAEHGALFVWDKEAERPRARPPRRRRRDRHAAARRHARRPRRPASRCTSTTPTSRTSSPDTSRDPLYTRYLIDVGCDRRGADPLPAPADRRAHRLDARAARPRSTRRCARSRAIAEVAAPLLRRVQVDKLSRAATGRPLMIKGLSPAWHEVERKLELAAPTNAPILIRGESGTGKDLVARAIHWNSRRAEQAVRRRSTAPRSPRRCSSRSCSVTSRARSPARASTRSASSRRRTAARCSSTRSASCR